MRCLNPFFTCASFLLAAFPQPGCAQDASPVAGTWRGNSECAVKDGPCHDETNVHRFKEIPGKENRLSCTASKVVDGKEIVMGSGEWVYDPAKRVAQTVGTGNPAIRLKLTRSEQDGDKLDGELTLPDGTVYRRIHLKRERPANST